MSNMEKFTSVKPSNKEQVQAFLDKIEKKGICNLTGADALQTIFIISSYVELLEALDIAISKNISVFELVKMFKSGALGDFVRSTKDEK